MEVSIHLQVLTQKQFMEFKDRLLHSYSKLKHLDCVSLPTMLIMDECVELKHKNKFHTIHESNRSPREERSTTMFNGFAARKC